MVKKVSVVYSATLKRLWLYWLQLRSVSQLISGNILVSGLTFLTSIVLARALSPEGRGDLANFVLWPVLLSNIMLFGIHVSLSRATAIHPEDAIKNYYIGFISLLLACILASIAYSGIVFTKVFYVSRFDTTALMIAALIIPFSAWNAFQIQMELGRSNFSLYIYGRVSFALAYLGSSLVLWCIHASKPTDYLWAFIVSTVFAALTTHIFIYHNTFKYSSKQSKVLGFSKLGFSKLGFSKNFRAAWPFGLSVTMNMLASTADKIAISLFFDSLAMGLYVIAQALLQVQSVINEAISPLFFVRLAQKDQFDKIDLDWLGKRFRQSVIINGCIGLAMIFAAPTLIPLIYGNAYSDSIKIIIFLIPAMCLRNMMRPFEEALKGSNRPLIQSFSTISMICVFVAGTAVAARIQSLQGIAISLLLASSTGLILVVTSVSRKSGLSIKGLFFPSFKDFGKLMSEFWHLK